LEIDNKPPAPKKQDWVGRWRVGENTVLIDDRNRENLRFKGWARHMASFSLSDFEFFTLPKGNKVVDKSAGGECVVTIRWVATLLLVNSTQYCVGAANSFDGVYRRTALTTDPKDEH
jgi:hypothetical protein